MYVWYLLRATKAGRFLVLSWWLEMLVWLADLRPRVLLD
jgi:hypothetical protein